MPITVEVGRVEAGRTYREHEIMAVKREGQHVVEDADLGRAVVEAFARDAATMREVVIYRPLDGAMAGRYIVTTLSRFARRFRPEPVVEPAPEPSPAAAPEVPCAG